MGTSDLSSSWEAQPIISIKSDFNLITFSTNHLGYFMVVNTTCLNADTDSGSDDTASDTDTNDDTASDTDTNDGTASDTDTNDGTDSTTGTDTTADTASDSSSVVPPGCGDGILSKDEACDDGNTKNGDGCQADCLMVQEGYSCNPPGKICRLQAVCGDGQITFPEQCDDGGAADEDGCDSLCQIEFGFMCTDEPSSCGPTRCGDSAIEGLESCDDGNDIPFDGCDMYCRLEPDCNAGPCTRTCGDGMVSSGEECDDGNRINGDACPASCRQITTQ